MTREELKDILLYEHKRDLRLTYIQYSIIGIAALLVLGLIAFLFISTGANVGDAVSGIVNDSIDSVNSSQYPAYLKIVIPLAFLSCIGYFVYGIVKLHKRPKHIEEFLQHVEKGSRTVSVQDSKDYKLKIPLLVVNINTGSVTSLHVVFQSSRKAYLIPVPAGQLEKIKEILAENS
ncbi:MAG: hypothetical protein LBG19_09070 [Prevotellaceae bacterium]|jgi:hypothetical protein|nr:hypothetical protein [Prevotellaceae bacterium]